MVGPRLIHQWHVGTFPTQHNLKFPMSRACCSEALGFSKYPPWVRYSILGAPLQC